MHTKQHRTSFPTLHRASTSLPAQSYHLPEHKACNRTQSFNNLSGNLLIKNSHPKQSSVLLQEIPLQHRAYTYFSAQSYGSYMSNTRTMSHSLQNTTEHKVYKAYNHTQSFSPAGTQCLTSTIHNTQSLCYLPGCFRPQSSTPQAKLCAFSSPLYRVITFRNTELHLSYSSNTELHLSYSQA